MKNKKLVILFSVLFLILTVLLLFWIYSLNSRLSTSAPSPSLSSPTSSFFPVVSPFLKELTLVSAEPPEGKKELLFSTSAILFTFSSDVNLYSVGVVIDPPTEVIKQISDTNTSVLVIRPKDKWSFNVPYTIKIPAGLKSKDGNSFLNQDVVYKIEFTPVEDVVHY